LVFYVLGNIDQIAHWANELGVGQGVQVGDDREHQVSPRAARVPRVIGQEVLADLFEQLAGGQGFNSR
jgi:hypothetical protein